MNVLIIGSEGFIGNNLIKYFLNKGDNVFGIDLYEQPSLTYSYKKISRLSHELDELLQEQLFYVIINAAGSANVTYSMTHPLLDFEANSLDTILILDAIRKYQPDCKYIHLSSAAVYGNPSRLPIKESDSLQPLSPYGWHKLISEKLCHEYTDVFNLSTAILRPFSVYGPGLKKQMFWDIFKKIKEVSGTLQLFGTGNESRDYIYIHDLCRCVDVIVEKGSLRGEIYNLASGNETTIANAVAIYFQALGIVPNYEFNNTIRQGDPLNWKADIENLKALGCAPGTSLQEGLAEVAAWIKYL